MRTLLEALGRYLNPRRRLYFTREGWLFTILTLSIGVVAVNTGHNLFYLVFALLLSVMVVSGLLSERVLRGIVLVRRLPAEITAGVPFAVTVEVRNPRQQSISYSLNVRDGAEFLPRRTLGYLSALGPGESLNLHYLAQVDRRGEHRFGPIHLSTRFPFGLFEKVRLVHIEGSFIAYPRHREAALRGASALGKERAGRRKWRWGEEISGFRAAVPADDHRFIHWPTTARVGQLMIREFLEEVEDPRPVFFDNRGAAGEKFERGVEIAAALLRFLAGRGVAATFATWDGYFQLTAKPESLRAALRHLALLRPSEAKAQGSFQAWCAQVTKEGQGIFIGGELSLPPALPPCEVVRP